MQNIIKDGAFLVDVRTPEEFSEGHISSSVNIPLQTLQAAIDQFRDKDQVVVFCRSGMRSAQAKSILEQNGIANVSNGGGIETMRKMMNHG